MKRISLLLLGLCFITWATGCCCCWQNRCGRCARGNACGDPCGGMAAGGCCGDGDISGAGCGMPGAGCGGGCAGGNCGQGGMPHYDEGTSSGWTNMPSMPAPGANPTPIPQIQPVPGANK